MEVFLYFQVLLYVPVLPGRSFEYNTKEAQKTIVSSLLILLYLRYIWRSRQDGLMDCEENPLCRSDWIRMYGIVLMLTFTSICRVLNFTLA